MFLVCSEPLQHTIECILNIIKDNSILIEVFTSLIVGSLWLRKFIRQRRAEAFFGFYAKLSLNIRILQAKLEDNDRLNITDPKTGNIFSLIYVDSDIKKICPAFSPISNDELHLYEIVAEEIKNIIINTENNVYPQKSNREKWYKSQSVLLLFCEFLKNKEYRNTTNIANESDSLEPKHITKCKELIESMNYINRSIIKSKY